MSNTVRDAARGGRMVTGKEKGGGERVLFSFVVIWWRERGFLAGLGGKGIE